MQSFTQLPRRQMVVELGASYVQRLLGYPPLRPNTQASPRSLFSTLSRLRGEARVDQQAQPLGDYYADLLATPIPKAAKSQTAALPTFVQSGDLSKEERAGRLFGTIDGSGYKRQSRPHETWRTINGVPVPPRPAEPDNCCMSGCVHCVWDDYRDDIEDWAARLHEAQSKSLGRGLRNSKASMHRAEVTDASTSMDDDGGGSEALWDSPSVLSNDNEEPELFRGIPVGIREFMATEKMIRERKRAKGEKSKGDAGG